MQDRNTIWDYLGTIPKKYIPLLTDRLLACPIIKDRNSRETVLKSIG